MAASNLFWNDLLQANSTLQPKGLKLIDLTKGKLSVNKEGISALNQQLNHLSSIFVFGNARSGKSFLMNCLAGVHGLFKVINSSTPCTRGVDISSLFIPHQQYIEHVNQLQIFSSEKPLPASASAPTLAFLDCEGQGDIGNDYDTLLALPLLITSKIVLFNHKGAPTVSDMLTKLGVLARAAEYIELPEETNGGEEETKSSPKKFGHLHVLFRDFSFDGDRRSVYSQLFDMEIVPKSTQKKAAKSFNSSSSASNNTNNADKEREESLIRTIQERNDIRTLLIENFTSISVHLFKQPSSADNLKAYKELPQSLVDEEFVREVEQLQRKIGEQTAEPKEFNGMQLNGPKLAQLLQQIIQNLNEKGCINVGSVYRAMEKENITKITHDLLDKLENSINQLKLTLPINKTALASQLSALSASFLDKFQRETINFTLSAEKDAKLAEITAVLERYRENLAQFNREKIVIVINTVIGDKFGAAKTNFELFCSKEMPTEGRRIEENYHQEKAVAMKGVEREFEQNLKLPDALDLQEYKICVLRNEEILAEALQYKSIENSALFKEKTIEKLQNELIKQQELLLDQNKRLELYLSEEKNNSDKYKTELDKLKAERKEEERRTEEQKRLIEQQKKELEELRKKQKKCVIL
jgi:hypothetical protein